VLERGKDAPPAERRYFLYLCLELALR